MSKTVTALLFVTLCSTCVSSCSRNENSRVHESENTTLAEKLGRFAYKANQQADKAARNVVKDLGRAATDARKGWKEEASKQHDDKHRP